MGRLRPCWFVAVFTFACGAAAVAPTSAPPRPLCRHGEGAARTIAPATASPRAVEEEAAAEEGGTSPALEEWENKHNGTRLPLDYESLSAEALADAKVVPLTSGSILAGVGNALYMLDARKRVVWKYAVPQFIFDFAFVESTGLIYGTAGDNTMFILDGATGRWRAGDSRNGGAAYGVAVPFGNDQCLVTDNFSFYRGDRSDVPPMQDGLTAWRGTKILWHKEFPPDAELRITGERIFAVTKTKSRILVREIPVPAGGGRRR